MKSDTFCHPMKILISLEDGVDITPQPVKKLWIEKPLDFVKENEEENAKLTHPYICKSSLRTNISTF